MRLERLHPYVRVQIVESAPLRTRASKPRPWMCRAGSDAAGWSLSTTSKFDEAEGADAGRGEVQRRGRPEPARAHQQHAGRLEFLLSLDTTSGRIRWRE